MDQLRALSKDESAVLVQKWIKSRDYWVLIPDFSQMVDVIDLEAQFYPKQWNEDFEGLMIMIPHVSVIFAAHKRRLPAAQLAEFLSPRLDGVSVSELDLVNKDLLFLAGDSKAHKMRDSLFNWLAASETRRSAKWN